MAILASIPYKGNRNMIVEILDVFTGGSGVKLATVRALAGQPFQNWTHGGWCPSDTCNWPAGLLRDVIIHPEQDSGSIPQEAVTNGR